MAEELEELKKQLSGTLNKKNRKGFRKIFLGLHGYEQSQLFSAFDFEQRKLVYTFISPEELANVFDDTEEDPGEMGKYLDEMSDSYVSRLLTEMYTDNVVDIFTNIRPIKRKKYLGLLHTDEANQVRKLIHYEDETAGSLMTTEFIAVNEDQTIGTAMQHVKREAQYAEIIAYIYVTDDVNKLVGVLSVRDLITHPALIKALDGKATINSTMMLVRTNNTIYSDFFYQLMKGKQFKKLVYLKVSGSSIPHLFQDDMKKFVFSTPDIREQKRIGLFLGKLDNLIAANQRQPKHVVFIWILDSS